MLYLVSLQNVLSSHPQTSCYRIPCTLGPLVYGHKYIQRPLPICYPSENGSKAKEKPALWISLSWIIIQVPKNSITKSPHIPCIYEFHMKYCFFKDFVKLTRVMVTFFRALSVHSVKPFFMYYILCIFLIQLWWVVSYIVVFTVCPSSSRWDSGASRKLWSAENH